jgi:hypothetical protein
MGYMTINHIVPYPLAHHIQLYPACMLLALAVLAHFRMDCSCINHILASLVRLAVLLAQAVQ